MSRFLFDSNVLLDIATADAKWLPWSQGQLAFGGVAEARGGLFRRSRHRPDIHVG